VRILITGAAGFIGSHLVRRLVTDGVHEVVAMDSLVEPSPAKRFNKGQFSMIDLIGHCLESTGPADVTIATWTSQKTGKRVG